VFLRRPQITILLGALAVLFFIRVVAQLVQFLFPVRFLPPFDAWQGGSTPYGLLLAAQVVILAVMTWTVWYHGRNQRGLSQRASRVLIGVGCIYALVMLVRLIGGYSFALHHHWFQARIPTFFHLVLAVFLMVAGYAHTTNARKPV
jgi:cytochrome bd-type quinol oxidase subunit 2